MLYELHYISPEHRSPELAGFIKSIGFGIRCSSHSPEDFLKRFSRRSLLVFVDSESAGAFTESEWQRLLTADQRPRLVVYCEKGPILPFLAGDGVFRPDDRDALQETLRTLLHEAFIARMRQYFNSSERFAARLLAGSLDALQEGVLVIGPSGRILYGNAFAEQSTGAYGIASVGRSIYPEGVQYCDRNGRILTKAEHPAFVALRTGTHIVQFRIGLETKGGRLWYSMNAIPLRGADSERIRFVLLTIRPETIETNLRKELYLTRLRLERLLSTMPALIYVVDVEQGRSRSLNRQLESYLGYTSADLEAGDFLISIMEQEDRDKFVEARTAILTEQREGEIEQVVRLRSRDGVARWFQIKETIYERSALGKVQQLLGTGIDITDVMESSKVITEQSLLISGIFHHTPIMILLRDEDGQIMSANQEFEQRTGYRSRDFLTKQLLDFVIVEDRQRATHFFEMLLRGERYEPFEARIRIKDGNIRHVLISSSFIKGAGGGNRYILTALEDITEFRSLQDKLAESRRMDSLGSMAGGVAHDFNNILQGLSNFNRLIQMEFENLGVGGETLERLKGFIANQRRLIERGADITGQVLEFSRQKELSPMLLNLNVEIREFLDIFTNQLPAQIRLERSLPDTPLYTVGNRVAFQRLLQNLFSNSLKALEDTDEKILRIALDRALLESRPPEAIVDIPPGEYARLVFYDSGAGIAEENKPRIFDPFYSHRPENPGTGLGLALVYSTVRRMNGSLAVRTRVGEFTEFVFYFPLTQEQDVPS
ncbi:MAG: PAS domain S-box protein [Leptonema illini]|uniref:histidine kinase n=1 Tax=Leptonema illini TaxID=183 RepID=A0A833H1L9_9LEPT|nr:MAG: PAS domain S-box protein [Leptonema illini]